MISAYGRLGECKPVRISLWQIFHLTVWFIWLRYLWVWRIADSSCFLLLIFLLPLLFVVALGGMVIVVLLLRWFSSISFYPLCVIHFVGIILSCLPVFIFELWSTVHRECLILVFRIHCSPPPMVLKLKMKKMRSSNSCPVTIYILVHHFCRMHEHSLISVLGSWSFVLRIRFLISLINTPIYFVFSHLSIPIRCLRPPCYPRTSVFSGKLESSLSLFYALDTRQIFRYFDFRFQSFNKFFSLAIHVLIFFDSWEMLFAHLVHIIVITVSTSFPSSHASYPQRRFHRFSFVPRCGVSLLISFHLCNFLRPSDRYPCFMSCPSAVSRCPLTFRCRPVVCDCRQSSYTDGFFQFFAIESPYAMLCWTRLHYRDSASFSIPRRHPDDHCQNGSWI